MGVDNFIIKAKYAKFAYYDTTGQEKYRSIVSSYYRNSDACLLVYDVNSSESFEEMAFYYNTVKEQLPDCLIYIVGCKSDK
jgi:GTPase SAR1 family protein